MASSISITNLNGALNTSRIQTSSVVLGENDSIFSNIIIANQGITGTTGSFNYLVGATGDFTHLNADNLTGNTGYFIDLTVQYEIQAQGGITGPTGSFDYLTGNTGYFVDLAVSNQITSNIGLFGSLGVDDSLGVNGSLGVTGSSTLTDVSCRNLFVEETLNVNGAVFQSSDYRLKTNVQTLNETHTVDNIRSVIYNKLDKTEIGFIAHEVEEVYPFLVQGEKNGETYQSVNYSGMIGILVNEIQTIKKDLTELKSRFT